MNALQCNDVKKNFGSFSALKGVDISVTEGECFGLLGPNGAGKSTLISMIYGALSRSSGLIEVFGKDPEKQGRAVRSELGIVTQENNLDTSMTVVENMRMFSRYVSVPKAQQEERIKQLLDFMLLSHKADAVIESLSGGMKRRLMFVRALLHNPRLVILDEPTTGLDPAVRQLLWDKVNELKKSGATIILTTHYMDEAERLCDRLVIMDEGMVRARGTPAELIREHSQAYVAGVEKAARAQLNIQEGVTVTEDSHNILLGADRLENLTACFTGNQIKPLFIRPANLEDVFLKITGRELADND
jgi:lipooligosaccharide transport system ATP-binding protein